MTLTHRFDTALQMVHDLHRAQVRKCNQVPYISHLLAVARIVLEACAKRSPPSFAMQSKVKEAWRPRPGSVKSLATH